MEDAMYMANVLRVRGCALCGADRKASPVLVRSACWVCGAALDDGQEVLLAVHDSGATPVCSDSCLASLLQAPVVLSADCPVCGSPWRDAVLSARACRVCAADLDPTRGYVVLLDAGRGTPFCGVKCIEMHKARVNPFCG
jgi:ribosomal protein L24E